MAGKHRKPSSRSFPLPAPPSFSLPALPSLSLPASLPTRLPVPLNWRTTGGVLAGAAVLGTAAVTAQASVLPFGSKPSGQAAAEMAAGTAPAKAPAKPGAPTGSASARKAPTAPKSSAPGTARRATGAAPGAAPGAKPSRPTAAEAIKLARSQVGISEDGNGETKFQEWYMGTSRARETVARDGGSVGGYSDASWCDMFISWVGDRLGFGYGMGQDAWTVAHARWFQENGRWGSEPRPGAIVFYDWDGSGETGGINHVGMVIKKNGDGTIQTVEGNTDNSVQVKTRSTGSVVGYGYPAYAPR
ncbi:CHAP domain-containing protein [Actinomadura fibrosa]|uniref:CHAP domain-containing protein n=1 Tax=Actinomadura fibrosa TaxID=111802 RepID=A0ABW2XMK5_9ACTN|nr:CHAP domain-containing protein [Actinomadura fibrosa]